MSTAASSNRRAKETHSYNYFWALFGLPMDHGLIRLIKNYTINGFGRIAISNLDLAFSSNFQARKEDSFCSRFVV